jgi:hypothetical protein
MWWWIAKLVNMLTIAGYLTIKLIGIKPIVYFLISLLCGAVIFLKRLREQSSDVH